MLNYSIHTCELYVKITLNEFWKLYDFLKELQVSIEKSTFLSYHKELETTTFIFRKLPYYGISSIKLLKTDYDMATWQCYLYIIINPYNAYIKCLQSDENIIDSEKIYAALKEVNLQLLQFLPHHIYSQLRLYRVDFCVNLLFSTQLQAEEYIKLLKQGVYPKCLKENLHYDNIQHRYIPYRDSLLLECGSYSFEVYPKHIQMKNSSLLSNTKAGIVRIELRAKRSKLKQLSKKYGMDFLSNDYVPALESAHIVTKQEITKILQKMIGNMDFYTFTFTKNKIMESTFCDSNKKLLLIVLLHFSKHRKGKEFLNTYNLSHSDWKKIIKKFNQLGCSPITVPRRYSCNKYPGIDGWNTYFLS